MSYIDAPEGTKESFCRPPEKILLSRIGKSTAGVLAASAACSATLRRSELGEKLCKQERLVVEA
jgi:hypothetical protein